MKSRPLCGPGARTWQTTTHYPLPVGFLLAEFTIQVPKRVHLISKVSQKQNELQKVEVFRRDLYLNHCTYVR